MAELNHTIVWCSDKETSSHFLTEILGLPPARTFFHFLVVDMANGVSLDFYQKDGSVSPQHYAFLVGDANSTRRSPASGNAESITGQTPHARSRARSTRISEDAAFISPIPTTTCLS